jgi:DNA-binding beta-propeller fold protein YncE
MTDIDPGATEISPDQEPVGADEPATGAELDGAAIEPEPRERRKLLLLAFLSAAAVVLLIFSGWYLLFRKPISEFPLPPISAEPMPTYGYSMYGPLRPTGIAVAPDGSRIYVTQTTTDTAVLVLDGRGVQVARMVPPQTGTDHVFVYVAINPVSGEVYVTDRPAAKILVYSPEGEYLRAFDPPETLLGWQPLGVGFDSAGHLFVTDPSEHRVHEFDAQGALVRSIGSTGQFNYPNAVVEDASGRLYVADSNNGRMVVLDPSGLEMAIVRRGPSEGDLGMPRGLAIDDQQRLFVVDTVDQSIKVYRPAQDPAAAPTFLGQFGIAGSGDGAFRYPNAIATDTRGRIYVADWDNDRVQVWTY